MLINIVQPGEGSSRQSEEENQLLHELAHIDKRLKRKNEVKFQNEQNNSWGIGRQHQYFQENKWKYMKEKINYPICNTNMEYFSQIGTEEVDQDSLFDPKNNFLALQKPNFREEKECSQRLKPKNSQKTILISDSENELNTNSTQGNRKFKSNSQLKKEMDYAYKKQKQEQHLKTRLPPKKSQLIGSRNNLSPFGHDRKSSATLLRSETMQSLGKINQKGKYIQKQAILEQNLSFQDDPNLFKFHTFKAQEEENYEDSLQDKVSRKPTKVNNKQQDRTSLQCTFKPKILKKSAQMAKSTKNVVERLSVAGNHFKEQKKSEFQSKQVLNRDRLEQLSQPRRLKTQYHQKTEQVPSFRPSLSKKSLQQMSHCMYDVATRNQIWQKQKQEKIMRMKEQEERQRQRRQNCTYSPSLCHYKGQNAPNLSRFGKQGIQNYFERVYGANNKGSRSKNQDSTKQNRQNESNMSKSGYTSKGMKKQKYEDAVKSLHNRILSLKI